MSEPTADAINAAIEQVEQDALRRMAQRAARTGGVPHYFSESDTFDRIPGGLLARRNNHVAPLIVAPDGEYGS
jgi:hypothetical protein